MTWLRDTRPMTTLRATRRPRSCAATHDHAVSRTRLVRHGATSPRSMPGGRASRAAGSAPARPVNLGPFIAARRAHHVLITGQAGAVDEEVEPGVGEAQVLVEAVGGRIAVPACLAIVGPVTDRAGATPGSIAAAETSRHCLLTHAGKPSTSIGEATGLPGGQDVVLLWGRLAADCHGVDRHQPHRRHWLDRYSTETVRSWSMLCNRCSPTRKTLLPRWRTPPAGRRWPGSPASAPTAVRTHGPEAPNGPWTRRTCRAWPGQVHPDHTLSLSDAAGRLLRRAYDDLLAGKAG